MMTISSLDPVQLTNAQLGDQAAGCVRILQSRGSVGEAQREAARVRLIEIRNEQRRRAT